MKGAVVMEMVFLCPGWNHSADLTLMRLPLQSSVWNDDVFFYFFMSGCEWMFGFHIWIGELQKGQPNSSQTSFDILLSVSMLLSQWHHSPLCMYQSKPPRLSSVNVLFPFNASLKSFAPFLPFHLLSIFICVWSVLLCHYYSFVNHYNLNSVQLERN